MAAAAARAGLKFVVFTDHGDATRPPEPPAYRHGVLCLDGVEISTTAGHYVAIGLPTSPYPLGGEARGVVEDVHRLGGFGIAAHPDSPKPELRWRDWAVPFDGLEIANPDTSWRTWVERARSSRGSGRDRWRAVGRLAAALLDYPFRPGETIATLLEDPVDIPARWANLTKRRRVVTVAGADAHSKLALRSGDPGDTGWSLPMPGYEAAFSVLSVHVEPLRPLTGDAAADAVAILDGIRAGHVFTAIDALASPASIAFTARNSRTEVRQGDSLATGGGPIALHVRTNAPRQFTATVMDGQRVVSGTHHEPDFAVTVPDTPAVYWVDVRATNRSHDISWLRTNAIYVRGPDPLELPVPRAPVKISTPMFDGRTTEGWGVEADPSSTGSIDVTPGARGPELRFRFALSQQLSPAPVVALAYSTPRGLNPALTRIELTIRADRPMRLSVQLRAPRTDYPTERWQRSIYIPTAEEARTIFLDEIVPVGTERTFRPPLADIRSVLLVIDPVNTKRGTSGEIRIRAAELQQ